MKKIFFPALYVVLAAFAWYAISGFADRSSTEKALKKRIAELEKQLTVQTQAPACDYKYFDNETDMRKFIAQNYNSSFNYATISANSTSLIKTLNSFPANSTVYISVIYNEKGKDLKVSNSERICNPMSICCPPNCTPPRPGPKSIALPQSFNPFPNL